MGWGLSTRIFLLAFTMILSLKSKTFSLFPGSLTSSVKNCQNIETSFPRFKATMTKLGMKINETD